MKDKYDVYLEEALKPTMEPDLELNKKIVTESKKSKGRRNKRVVYNLAKVAVAAIVLVVIAPTVANATGDIMEKFFVTDHTISTGNLEYVSDDWITAEEEEPKVEQLQQEEGDSSVSWTSKRVERVNDYATNTYFYYDDYGKALADSGHDNWFNTKYKTESATYVLSETADFIEKSLDADLYYNEKTFHVTQDIMTGNVDSNGAYSILLQNTGNVRTYVSASGEEFTLVDENRKDDDFERVRTYTMIAYDQYYGYLSFEHFSEAEIQSVLDTVLLPEDTQGVTSNEQSTGSEDGANAENKKDTENAEDKKDAENAEDKKDAENPEDKKDAENANDKKDAENADDKKDAENAEDKKDVKNAEDTQNNDTAETGSDYDFLNGICEFNLNGENSVSKVTIYENGSFEGEYHGMAKEESGTDYPNGTIYYSFFSGKLKSLVKVNEYTYEAEASEITYKKEVGEEEISDGQRSVFCIAYGLADTKKIQFFLPGTSLSQLPDDFLKSVGLLDQKEKADAKLESYGLYSVDTKQGMKGYAMDEAEKMKFNEG